MEKTIRLKRELAYTGMILKIYRDTVVANGIEEVYDYIHHDGAAAVLPVTKDGKILMVRQYRNRQNSSGRYCRLSLIPWRKTWK